MLEGPAIAIRDSESTAEPRAGFDSFDITKALINGIDLYTRTSVAMVPIMRRDMSA